MIYTQRWVTVEIWESLKPIHADIKVIRYKQLEGQLLEDTIDKTRGQLMRIEYYPPLTEALAWIVGKIDYLSLESLQLCKLEETYTSEGVHELIIIG